MAKKNGNETIAKSLSNMSGFTSLMIVALSVLMFLFLVIIGVVNVINAFLVFSNGYVVYGNDIVMKK